MSPQPPGGIEQSEQACLLAYLELLREWAEESDDPSTGHSLPAGRRAEAEPEAPAVDDKTARDAVLVGGDAA